MPVVEKFIYHAPDRDITEPLEIKRLFSDWLSSLTEEERMQYESADNRQKALRKRVEDSGDLIVDGWYIWKDHKAAATNKPNDEEWIQFFQRFVREHRMSVEVVRIES